MVAPDLHDLTDPNELLRPTAALLAAHLAVAAAIEQRAVAASTLDGTASDLLSPSYVSRRIDRAVADGLVERQLDPGDRRAQIITLTPAGRAALDDFLPHLVQVIDEVVFNTFDLSEVDTLVELLGRLEAAAETAVAPRP